MTALPCPEPGCPVTEVFVGELAAHLRDAHGAERDASIAAAKRVQATVDPFGLDANGIKTHVETPPDDLQEDSVPKPKPRVTPKVCKVCARLGAPCKRHGGVGRSTSFGGKGKAAPAIPAASNGPVTDAARRYLREKLDEQIADTRAELRALDRLRASVA